MSFFNPDLRNGGGKIQLKSLREKHNLTLLNMKSRMNSFKRPHPHINSKHKSNKQEISFHMNEGQIVQRTFQVCKNSKPRIDTSTPKSVEQRKYLISSARSTNREVQWQHELNCSHITSSIVKFEKEIDKKRNDIKNQQKQRCLYFLNSSNQNVLDQSSFQNTSENLYMLSSNNSFQNFKQYSKFNSRNNEQSMCQSSRSCYIPKNSKNTQFSEIIKTETNEVNCQSNKIDYSVIQSILTGKQILSTQEDESTIIFNPGSPSTKLFENDQNLSQTANVSQKIKYISVNSNQSKESNQNKFLEDIQSQNNLKQSNTYDSLVLTNQNSFQIGQQKTQSQNQNRNLKQAGIVLEQNRDSDETPKIIYDNLNQIISKQNNFNNFNTEYQEQQEQKQGIKNQNQIISITEGDEILQNNEQNQSKISQFLKSTPQMNLTSRLSKQENIYLLNNLNQSNNFTSQQSFSYNKSNSFNLSTLSKSSKANKYWGGVNFVPKKNSYIEQQKMNDTNYDFKKIEILKIYNKLQKKILTLPSFDLKIMKYSDLKRYIFDIIVEYKLYSDLEIAALQKLISKFNPYLDKPKIIEACKQLSQELLSNNNNNNITSSQLKENPKDSYYAHS